MGTHNTALGAYTIISANDATVGDIDVRVTGSSITLSQGGREHVIDLSMLTRRVEGEIGTALGIAALGTAIAVATLAAPLIAATAVIVTMVGIAAATL